MPKTGEKPSCKQGKRNLRGRTRVDSNQEGTTSNGESAKEIVIIEKCENRGKDKIRFINCSSSWCLTDHYISVKYVSQGVVQFDDHSVIYRYIGKTVLSLSAKACDEP